MKRLTFSDQQIINVLKQNVAPLTVTTNNHIPLMDTRDNKGGRRTNTWPGHHFLILICLAAAAYTSSVWAQVSTDPASIDKATQQHQRELRREDERARPPSLLPQRQPSLQPKSLSDTRIKEGGPCFTIVETDFQDQTNSLPVPPGYDVLNGRCADKKALSDLLSSLNHFYQETGLITTRVYLKPQNIGAGRLVLIAKAGLLQGLRYADGQEADTRLNYAYPIATGGLIHLRALEQGLDNFNRPPSQSGKAELLPGSDAGGSVLVMKPEYQKPWRIEATYNNHGYDSTGLNKGGIGYSHDNLLNLNEIISLNYNRNAHDDGNSKRSEGLSFSYSQPYKHWLFGFSRDHYRYKRILAGINQNYVIDGFSRSLKLDLARLLHRNRQARVYMTASLAKKRSENYIEDLRIPSQSRELAIASLGLRGDYGFANGARALWSLGAYYKIDALGSQDVIPGLADDNFNYLRGSTTLLWPIADGAYTYSGELVVQYSNDELTGTEQFSAGGISSVRGFHQDAIYGNTGIYLRNQLSSKPKTRGSWKFTSALFLDLGHVKSPDAIDWSGNQVAGAGLSFGIEYDKQVSLDLLLARALTRPDALTGERNQAHFTLTVKF